MNKFSHDEYKYILNWVQSNYDVIDYKDVNSDTESFALIRHDVEFSPMRALKLAQIDSELGIKASYFFQIRNNCYNSLSGENINIIRQIDKLGHHIGAHINTSTLESNDELERFVIKDIETLSNYAEVDVNRFSFHRPQSYQLKNYIKIVGLINAYDDKFFHYYEDVKPKKLRVKYIADSNHIWKYGHPTTTNNSKLQLNFHPFSWTRLGYKNIQNFKTLVDEKNKETVESINSEIKTFPKELL